MGFLDDDSRGFLISLDLLIALIPLTIIMGMMVTDMDNVLYTVQNTVYQSSLERVGADTVNTLIKTPGSPYNWEEIGNPQVIGLAIYDNEKKSPVQNSLDPRKLAKMSESDVVKLIGPNYGYNLTITAIDNGNVIKQMGTPIPDVPNVVRIERLVLSSNLQAVSILGTVRDAGAHPYPLNFQTSANSLEIYDYYILIVNNGYDSVTAYINGVQVVNSTELNKETKEFPKQINETILKNEDNYTTNAGTITPSSTSGASMDAYVVAVPKGTPKEQITKDNIEQKKCRFIFYIWTV